ncbi:MAG: hypothetical protein GX298_05500 [Planctomycetes bacterium]|nr:hypothetical protein [Planctomycetota bacterium]
MKQTLEEIAYSDGRYDPRALKFVFDGLAATIEKLRQTEGVEQPRHITGQELSWGLADLAMQRWGRLAAMVLAQWGIHATRDFGEIVYLMISQGWMTSQETDTIDDFNHVFDFDTVFEQDYHIDIR